MTERLAALLLPCRLEDFGLVAHARDLLAIPRVLAIEPSHRHTPRLFRESVPLRQAKRLKLPGQLRVVVLYHPMQYPLARALLGRHAEAELWYMRPERDAIQAERPFTRAELLEFDDLARERAAHWQDVSAADDVRDTNEALRRRMVELEIISSRPFVPGARIVGG